MKKTSQKGLDLIKHWESFVGKIYKCPANIDTIGYGHVVLKGETFPPTITEKEAEDLLKKDVEQFEKAINDQHLELTQNQFDVLVSFVFNVGIGAFSRSTLLKKLKRNDHLGASKEFAR